MSISNASARDQLALGARDRQLIEQVASRDDPEWPDPIPLEHAEAGPWPKGAFPESVETFLQALSDYSETPLELSSLTALAVLSACAQGTWTVETRRGYAEPVTLWTLVALGPGNRKSSVFAELIRPLRDYEKAESLQLSEAVKEARALTDVIDAQKQKLRSSVKSETDAASRTEILRQISELDRQLPIIPRSPRLFTDDATPEALTRLLGDYDGRMAVLSDEGGIFETLAGRYDKSGQANLDTCLKGYSADASIRCDRTSHSAPLIIDNPHLAFGLCVQPEVLIQFRKKDGFRGRGFLARFLFCVPRSRVGSRSLDTPAIAGDLRETWRAGILAILRHRTELGKSPPRTLTLSASATALFQEHARNTERAMREGGRLDAVVDWAAKLPGQLARVAGLLHIARYSHEDPARIEIDERDMLGAIAIVKTLESHALRAFDLMQEDLELSGARRIRDWLVRTGSRTFSARDAFDQNRCMFPRRKDLDPALKCLAEHELIRELPRPNSRGRPSERYEVNPKLFSAP